MKLDETLVIAGGGGHAKVIIDICRKMGKRIAGYTCLDAGQSHLLGIPCIGDDSALPRLIAEGIRTIFVAIGDNEKRKCIGEAARAMGFSLANALSPEAVIADSVEMGSGIAVMPGAVINAGSKIGNGAIINTGATVDHDCNIGAYAHIAPGVHLAGLVKVGEGAFLGIGVSAIPRVSIGAWAIVGAGGVVIRDISDGSVAVGVPATVLKEKTKHDG